MKFTHDFRADLETLIHEIDHGEPFAFSRFGDGELALITNRQILAADGWEVPSEPTEFTKKLGSTLSYGMENTDRFYLGLGCGCNDAGCCDGVQDELRSMTKLPVGQITTSNLFVNGNFDRWQEYLMTPKILEFFIVGPWPGHADFRVPSNCVNMRDPLGFVDEVVMALERVRRPILVCAGPMSNIIIAYYWYWMDTQCKSYPQTIIDVGSAIGMEANSRGYQNPLNPNRNKMCRVLGHN